MRQTISLAAAALAAAVPAAALAHVSISSGAATAGATQLISFGVGHGCAGADTYRLRIEIPAGVTSVRPLANAFGRATVEKDAAGTVVAVVWQKADADLLEADLAYYELVLRAKLPDQPFTTVYFPALQTCRALDGTMSSTNWSATPGAAPADGGAEDEPAPALTLMPARRAGWNKLTVPRAVADLTALFADAQIVWKGTAAFSTNPITAELIRATSGVTTLSSLSAGDEIWVKY